MIELWGMASPNVQKVLIALEELELDYQLHFVDVFENEQYEPGFEKLSPNRKVPIIVDSEGPDGEPFTLWESGAILYLAEKAGRLMPAEPRAKHTTMQWLMFQMAGVGPMFGQHSHFLYFAKGDLHAYSRSRYGTEVLRLYDVVEGQLANNRFIAGEDYTIADIACWPWIRFNERRGMRFDGLPNVRRWVDEIGARPAVQRGMAPLKTMKRVDVDKFAAEKPDKLDRYLGRGRYARV